MDYEAIGRKIKSRTSGIGWIDTTDESLGRAAVEAVNEVRPAATEETVREWCGAYNPSWGTNCTGIVLAALRHFAAPGRVEMMIDGMTQIDLARAMHEYRRCNPRVTGVVADAECAHRLANTPKTPAVGPDARAKEMAWEWYQGANFDDTYKTAEEYWAVLGEKPRNGWRAIAATEGK